MYASTNDELEDEFLCMCAQLQGRKIVCGTQKGPLAIFSWGHWGEYDDKFSGHPASVDTIVPLTESIVCTGGADGIIRLISILPNKMLGVLGDTEDLPIEKLRLSRDHKYIASSCSNTVTFWNIEFMFEDLSDSDSDDGEKTKLPSKLLEEGGELKRFFADL